MILEDQSIDSKDDYSMEGAAGFLFQQPSTLSYI